MIAYRASLDVPAGTAYQVARWLAAHRKVHDVRPWQRAATPFVQAVMVLRWFREATDLRILARDAQVRISAPSEAGYDLWVFGQTQTTRREHPGRRRPERVSGLGQQGRTRLGPRHHRRPHPRSARPLPALYPAAATGLPTLTDKGYTGAGIGIQVPLKGDKLATGNRNAMINALRAPAERANALLKSTWRVLRRITPGPLENRRHHRRTRPTPPSQTHLVRKPQYRSSRSSQTDKLQTDIYLGEKGEKGGHIAVNGDGDIEHVRGDGEVLYNKLAGCGMDPLDGGEPSRQVDHSQPTARSMRAWSAV